MSAQIYPLDFTKFNNLELDIPSGQLKGRFIAIFTRDYGEIEIYGAELNHITDLDNIQVINFNIQVNRNIPIAVQEFVLSFDTKNGLQYEDYIYLSQLFLDPALTGIELGFKDDPVRIMYHNSEDILNSETLNRHCYYVNLYYTYEAWERINPDKRVTVSGG